MEEFKAINTQEELNAVIGSRLAKAEQKVRSEYADYNDLKSKVETLTAENTQLKQSESDLKGKVAKYEADSVKNRIATKYELPIELASRLRGSTEEELEADAQEMKKYFGKKSQLPPVNSEPMNTKEGKTYKAYKSLLPDN